MKQGPLVVVLRYIGDEKLRSYSFLGMETKHYNKDPIKEAVS